MNESISPISGWLLVTRDEVDGARTGEWYIAWIEPFGTKKRALAFAKTNRWQQPYRAVRGELRVTPTATKRK